MDKRVILSVAGSGKTSLIVGRLDLSRRFLITTYTNANYYNLRLKIIEKFGFFPENITLLSYFTFLHSFCYKPILSFRLKSRGILFKRNQNRYAKGIDRYLSSGKKLYSNRVADLIIKTELVNQVIDRLNKFYDAFYIDEIQDISGHDFNLILNLANSNLETLFVGDFYQHTFDTSTDGAVNKNLYTDYDRYIDRFNKAGIIVDTETLINSYRCPPSVCEYIRQTLGITIHSHNSNPAVVTLHEEMNTIEEIMANPEIVKLFYKEHFKYNCHSNNWGACKGEDNYNEVSVVLNDNTLDYVKNNRLNELKPVTRNKLYVAITRTRSNIHFIPQNLLTKE